MAEEDFASRFEPPKVSKTFTYGLMATMLCFGTASTIVGKYLDE